jgi:predicted molibdopterin-dependent oxidoreductase YjgC
MGTLPDYLPGFGRIDDERARVRFEEIWEAQIPSKPGFGYTEMFEKIFEGKIKALYIFGEDPLITLPNIERIKQAINRLEFLVVQDIFMTNIGNHANIILPGVSFAEKDGTFTNMERKVQRVRKAISPIGEAWPDWKIFCSLSEKMGYPMRYESPSRVMEEISEVVPIYKGINYSRLEKEEFRWSSNNGRKMRFCLFEFKEPIERPNEQYPLWIIPRGFHYHYGIGTTLKRAEGLAKVFPETLIELNIEDASKLGIKDGESVRVISPRGEVETNCRLSKNLPNGVAYFSTTFYPVFINNLLISDTSKKYPEYKYLIGRVEKK